MEGFAVKGKVLATVGEAGDEAGGTALFCAARSGRPRTGAHLQGNRGQQPKTRTRRCGGRSRRLAAMALRKVEQMLAAGT
jgi:hypothetical protein